MLILLEIAEGFPDPLDVLCGKLAVLLAHVLAKRLIPLGGVDELNLVFAVLGLSVGEHPDVGRNAGVIEHVQRQSYDCFKPVVLDYPAADVALTLTGITGKERRSVVNLGNAATQRGVMLHLAELVHQEHELPITGAGNKAEFRVAVMLNDEAVIEDVLLAAHALEIDLPALAVRRIREHEIEFLSRKGIGGES